MAFQQTYHASRIAHHVPCLVVVLVLYLLSCAVVRAQQVEGTNFKVADLFEPPNEGQIRSLIQGARWRHEGAQTAVYDAKVQTFTTNGAVQLIIEAPECFYDEPAKAINSAGPVKFRTADGQFTLSGVGFTWLQTNSILYISNQVQTVVLSTNSNPKGMAVTVISDRFEYSRKSGIGIYNGNVRAVGSNVNFRATSDVMEVFVPERQHQLQTITMKQKVVLDYEMVEATGDEALYTAATGIAKITGSPAWHDTEGRRGTANELTIDRTNKTFLANGQAWVKMPAQNVAGPNALFSSTTNSTSGTNQFVQIFSDHYQFQTNAIGKVAQFGDHVLMIDTDNVQTNGTLTSATLSVTLFGTNELQSMIAERDVIIEKGDNQFTGQKAVYTATNSVLELTGNPTWRAADRDGKGEVICVDLKQNKMDVLTNAYARLPASQLGPTSAITQASGDSSSARQTRARLADAGKGQVVTAPSTKEKVEGNFSPLPPVPEDRPKTKPPKRETQPSTPEFAEVFSERYTITTNAAMSTARFEGGVRIVHPRMNWVCRTVNVDSPNTNKDVTIAAEQAVEFTLQENDQNVHGTCDRAVYNYSITPTRANDVITLHTNDLMTLTGNPIVETTNGIITNKVIMLDCANNKLIAPGKYGIYGTNGPPIPTNAFRFSLPKKKK